MGALGTDNSSLVGGIDSSTGLPRAMTIARATGGVLTSDQFVSWAENAQTFSGATGKLTTSITGFVGVSIYNPVGSGKTLAVFAARCGSATLATHSIYLHNDSIDPALAISLPITNRNASGAASVASATYTNALALTPVGSVADSQQVGSPTTFDFISPNGDVIILPAGSGIEIAVAVTANGWFAAAKWSEY